MFNKLMNQALAGIHIIFERLTKQGRELGSELGHRAEDALKEARKNAPVIEIRKEQKQNITRSRLASFLFSSLVWMGLSRIPWRQIGLGAVLLISSMFSKRAEESEESQDQLVTPSSRTDYRENMPDRSPIRTELGGK